MSGWPARTLLMAMSLVVGVACATAPREAEPLPIERLVPAPRPRPLFIRRSQLHEVLRKGPGRFLARMPVEPYRSSSSQFVGYRVLGIYGNGRGHPDGVQVGDVITAVNEMPIARPEQFMVLWDLMSHASAIEVDVIRDRRPLRVVYPIVD